MGNINISDIDDILSRFQSGFPAIIDCEDGWSDMVVSCHNELKSIDPDYTIAQIKEKFGGLRYYFATSQPSLYKQMTDIVAKYEKVSFTKCQLCGKEAETVNFAGLIKTLCKKHRKTPSTS
jgi:hypothetical protein